MCGVAFADTRVILPFGPGGGVEITYRQLEKYLTQDKDMKIVTWYKPGASGVVGLQELSKSPKDGSVLSYTTIASLSEALKTSDLKFEYVTATNKLPMVLITNNKTGIKNYKDFVKQSKSSKSYSFGYTSPAQLYGINQIINKVQPKKEMVVAPYKAGSNVITDLIGGQIDFAYLPYQSIKEYTGTKKIIILGSSLHIKDYPNILQFNKSYKDWVDISGYAVVLPKDTPKEYVDYWQKILYDYMNDTRTKEQLKEEDSVAYPPGESFLKQMVFQINK